MPRHSNPVLPPEPVGATARADLLEVAPVEGHGNRCASVFAGSKREERQAPGPQRAIFAPSLGVVLLQGLLVGVTLLTVQAVLRRNLSSDHWLLSWELVTPSTGLSLFVGVATIIAVRRNVALGMRPILTYTGRQTEVPTYLRGQTTVRAITVRNAGGGVALVNRCSFHIRWADEAEASGPLTYAELVEALRSRDPQWQESLWVADITSGFALAADESYLVAELAASTVKACACLDMHLRFSSLVDARFEKDIFLVSRTSAAAIARPAPNAEVSPDPPETESGEVRED